MEGCRAPGPRQAAVRHQRQEGYDPMTDPRWDQLADILVNHSTRLAAGETLLVECFDLDDSTLPRLLVQKAARKGAYPLVETKDTRILRDLIRNASEPQ